VQGANGGSGARTTYTYDGHKLLVYETANELGHVVRTTYDAATGVLVKREGPNPLQASNSGAPAYETERWTLDGFGRILTHSVTMTPAGAANDAYKERVIERVSYDDWRFFNTGEPVSLRAERLRDFAGANANAVWIPTVQTYDGLGRILVKSEFFGGAMAPVATYTYNDLGKVQSLAVPDPSNAGSSVAFAYGYDGLGRVVHLERPDGNGVTIAYAGLAQTITEDTADGSGGSTTKVFDPRGRLIRVEERLAGGASAVSAYAYDANDNVSRITDADGNVTHLLHDWLGNRTRIVRGARAWHYAYDLNGNLVSEQSPMPPGADASHYTVLYAYDDLDRLVRTSYYGMRVSSATTQNPPNPEPEKQFAVFLPVVVKAGGQAVALAAVSPLGGEPALETMATMETMAQMELLDTMETIRYTYDGGAHGLGRLSRVELPFGSVQYGYDVRGLMTLEQRSFALTGAANVSDTQSVRRTYNALGQLTHSQWDDGQQWAIGYDERGLVDTVSWYDPAAAAWQTVADYQRTLAGLPMARTSSYGQTRTFAYDTLGRPVADTVTLDGQANPLAERRYAYTHAGDLASVAGHTNGVSANAAYTYDAQHRLLSAAGPNGYQGNFNYSAAGNILSAKVTWSGSAASRNVIYSYGAVDPLAVDRLQDAATGATYGAFRYDPVGNMTHRTASGGASLLHWNALGQVRQVDAPAGSETYYYDHGFQRMLAVSGQEGVRFWFVERETHYALDGAETNAYLHLSAGGPALARIENNTDVELQYADTLQNLMFALDRAGSVLASFLYGPFGEVVSETGSDDHRRQFNGKESDAVSGLRYYGYRYYDPVALRWNSADPLYSFVPDLGLNEPQRMNLYAFSMNNSVRYYDPDGRDVGNGSADDDYRSNTRGYPYCTGDWLRWCNSDDSSQSEPASDETDEIVFEPAVNCGAECKNEARMGRMKQNEKRASHLEHLVNESEEAIQDDEEILEDDAYPASLVDIVWATAEASAAIWMTTAGCAASPATAGSSCAAGAAGGAIMIGAAYDRLNGEELSEAERDYHQQRVNRAHQFQRPLKQEIKELRTENWDLLFDVVFPPAP
jgi:RHS repeat-associated protein